MAKKEAEDKKDQAAEAEEKPQAEEKPEAEEKPQAEEKKPQAEEKPKAEEKPEPAAKPEPQQEFAKKIKKLGDEIVELTLKEAVELADYLKAEHGIEPAAGGAVMMAGPADAGPAEEAEEQTEFDVILKDIGDKKNKIPVIKAVRALTSLGLIEAKGLVEGAPKAVKEKVSKDDAEEARKQLEEAGATVEVQ